MGKSLNYRSFHFPHTKNTTTGMFIVNDFLMPLGKLEIAGGMGNMQNLAQKTRKNSKEIIFLERFSVFFMKNIQRQNQ